MIARITRHVMQTIVTEMFFEASFYARQSVLLTCMLHQVD